MNWGATPLLAGLGLLLLVCSPGQAQDKPESSTGKNPLSTFRVKAVHVDDAQLSVGAHVCDVTDAVRQKCEGRIHCEVEVNTSLCTATVMRGLIHTLTVHYACRAGSMPIGVSEEEPRSLKLSCLPNLAP